MCAVGEDHNHRASPTLVAHSQYATLVPAGGEQQDAKGHIRQVATSRVPFVGFGFGCLEGLFARIGAANHALHRGGTVCGSSVTNHVLPSSCAGLAQQYSRAHPLQCRGAVQTQQVHCASIVSETYQLSHARESQPQCLTVEVSWPVGHPTTIALPASATSLSWIDILQEHTFIELCKCWALADGHVICLLDCPSMPTPRCLQVRGRLNGGSKSKHADADVQKLIQHLIQKGVSEDEAAGRADQVLQHITPDQLQQAYRSLEPWAAVKAAVGQKVRLVTPAEARDLKQKGKSGRAEASSSNPQSPRPTSEDPWSVTDPPIHQPCWHC